LKKKLINEKGEALGAIGDNSVKVREVLNEYASDKHAEVAETCYLALKRLDWLELQKLGADKENLSKNPYYSVDPAPPHAKIDDVKTLRQRLLNEDEDMFERYRAMFALRNNGTDEAVLALCDGLKCKSALFRHEIAYVLGQIQSPLSFDALRRNLEDMHENEMVRHECAEALGSLATDNCIDLLSKFLTDDKRVVKESCEVALDMTDYERSNELQYADGLLKL
jgi:deoxyhypusine monooxygenase